MIEVSNSKKNKIKLEDYDYEKDIKNRQILAQLNKQDVEVLEELLYSPIKCSIEDLADTLEMSTERVQSHLKKLESTDLFENKGDHVLLNKDMRKYFESQILKFEDDFTPGMEFLQSLLKKVPIHVLPNWYPIPRSSNNIFDSLVEKYLKTPQTFQRYLSELNLEDETLQGIVQDVFSANEYTISSRKLMEKYSLSQTQFEEAMLHLEFNFVCCLIYREEGDEWVEAVTLFHEWKEYLNFVKATEPKRIEEQEQVLPFRPHEFSYIEDLSHLLTLAKKRSLSLTLGNNETWALEESEITRVQEALGDIDSSTEVFSQYIMELINKLTFLKLARIEGSSLKVNPLATEWLALPKEKRALGAYKHTLTNYSYNEFDASLYSDRNLREIEKSITRILHSGWVYFDDYMDGIFAQISESSKIELTKKGRHWHYSRPEYSKEEKRLIHLVTYDWMFEAGIIMKGTHAGRECIQVTSFGQSLFGQE